MRRMRTTTVRRASASTSTASSASASSTSSSQLSRRSSLKKTSSYGPHRAAAATASSMSMTRRNSMNDLQTATTNKKQKQHPAIMSRSASMSHIPRSVSFNQQVETTLVDYVEDICPRAPLRLFYSDEDYARMKSDRQHDARRILLEKEEREHTPWREAREQEQRQRQQQLRNIKTSSYFFQQQKPPSDQEEEVEPSEDNNTTENNNNNNDDDDDDYNDYDWHDDSDEDDDESNCKFGIDHLICTRDERKGRIRRARGVLVAVLDEQERADEEEPTTVGGTERRAARLARASLRASKVARIQAIERAAEVEEHCAKMRLGRRHSSAGVAEEGRRPLPLRCSRRASCA